MLSHSKYNIDNRKFILADERIIKLIEILESKSNQNAKYLKIDESKIQLENYQIFSKNEEILSITNLEFLYSGYLLDLNDEDICSFKNILTKLFKEIKSSYSNHSLIDSLDDNSFIPSKEQSVKLAIIKVIIERPEALILDETFDGLNKNALL